MVDFQSPFNQLLSTGAVLLRMSPMGTKVSAEIEEKTREEKENRALKKAYEQERKAAQKQAHAYKELTEDRLDEAVEDTLVPTQDEEGFWYGEETPGLTTAAHEGKREAREYVDKQLRNERLDSPYVQKMYEKGLFTPEEEKSYLEALSERRLEKDTGFNEAYNKGFNRYYDEYEKDLAAQAKALNAQQAEIEKQRNAKNTMQERMEMLKNKLSDAGVTNTTGQMLASAYNQYYNVGGKK